MEDARDQELDADGYVELRVASARSGLGQDYIRQACGWPIGLHPEEVDGYMIRSRTSADGSLRVHLEDTLTLAGGLAGKPTSPRNRRPT